MTRVGIVLGLCATSALTPTVPPGTTVALIAAALAAVAAVRLHATADVLAVRGSDTAVTVMRLARFLYDLALALSLLALLYIWSPF